MSAPAAARTIRKGVRVETTGHGRTARWGRHTGRVTRRARSAVFVVWDNTSFEDQMDIAEVRAL